MTLHCSWCPVFLQIILKLICASAQPPLQMSDVFSIGHDPITLARRATCPAHVGSIVNECCVVRMSWKVLLIVFLRPSNTSVGQAPAAFEPGTFIPQSVEGPLWRGRQSMVAHHAGHHPTPKGLFACEVSCALFPFSTVSGAVTGGVCQPVQARTSDELILSCGLVPTQLCFLCSQAFRFYFFSHT